MSTARSQLGWPTLFAYAAPGIPLAALTLPLYILLPTFYADALGLPLAAIGAALFAVRIADAASDPIIGWASDRYALKGARRRSWFAASIPIVVVATVALFWPPLSADATYLTIWGIVLSIGYTMAILPYSAWGAELTGNYDERARVTASREGFILLGTLLAIALPFSFFSLDNAAEFHGLAALAVLVAVLLPITGTILLWHVPEPRNLSRTRLSLRAGISQMAANKPFLKLLIAYLINGLANGLPASLFLFFVAGRLEAPDLQGPLLFLYFLCGVAGVPLFTSLARRTSKHRSWAVAMAIACAVFAFALTLGPGDTVAFAAICVATGLCVGGDLALPSAIQADVIDVDTAAGGEQRSGTYFAAWSLATKLSLALAAGIAFPVLGAFGFDASNPANSSAEGIAALSWLYAGVPIGLKLTAVALIWNFPIDRAQQEATQASIGA
ncbi:MAG: MFS transporter [Pseudomonadota bacterium]